MTLEFRNVYLRIFRKISFGLRDMELYWLARIEDLTRVVISYGIFETSLRPHMTL